MVCAKVEIDLGDQYFRAGRNLPRKFEKGALPPFQKAIPLAVALILQLYVPAQRLIVTEGIDDLQMIDDQIHQHQRIDLYGSPPGSSSRLASQRDRRRPGHR